MLLHKHFWGLLILSIIVFSCDKFRQKTLFTNLPASQTHIYFENNLTYTEAFNTYTYRNFYNGGGVAIGDLNKDGFPEIFFCGNMVSNKLYLNKGNNPNTRFTFEDITEKVGLKTTDVWSTGVSFADVNGDGWLDIYVCKSGKPTGGERKNSLYINNGFKAGSDSIPTFTDRAVEYGIADYGFSTHAVFFDYDKDGDLDMYLLNNSIRNVGVYDLVKDQRNIRDPKGANKLYRNNGKTFEDVSQKAGIYGSAVGFGLGVTIGDINKDGWQDIYVSNDFFEKDYLYINQKNGTFFEELEQYMGEISLGSMGADMADINNDAYPEVFVTEMLPETNERVKTKAAFDDWNKYQSMINTGYHKQFSRNVLQLNLGKTATEKGAFSEISRMAGVHATDWSWGALMVDLDNDGLKDIYVANGIYKDLTDLDYINYNADPLTVRRLMEEKGKFLKELIDIIPSNPMANYAFQNNGNLTFDNKAKEWGLAIPSFSNGAAYGDLDNDGDLDLVINNVNMPAFVFQNNAIEMKQENHFLTFKIKGIDQNTAGLGTQITIFHHGKRYYQELAPMRGYQSNVDERLHFGLGNLTSVDSVLICYPNQQRQLLKHVKTNQFLTLDQSKINLTRWKEESPIIPLFKDVSADFSIDFVHQHSNFIDFNREPLLFHGIGSGSPKTAVADVNQDGLEDFFISGSLGKAGKLYLQNRTGKFQFSPQSCFEKDKLHEDTAVLFFDANGDHFPDLYLASGGSQFIENVPELQDRLYLNDGKGNFNRLKNALPASINENTSSVKSADFDHDGDMDLLVGIRAKSFFYGLPMNGYLWQNNGKGIFTDVTNKFALSLQKIGMITDVAWLDFDHDHDMDMVLVGEWMGIKLLENKHGKFTDKSEKVGLQNTNGFWNCIEIADVNKDGFEDLIVGNLGLNTRLKATQEQPIEMYVADFDQNGKIEQLITVYNGEKSYPMATRKELLVTLPFLKSKLPLAKDYANATMDNLFDESLIKQAYKNTIFSTSSTCFINHNGVFTAHPLPIEAQLSPMYACVVTDFDGDNNQDILWGGNLYTAKPEIGIYDGSVGQWLKGDGKGNFNVCSIATSGVNIKGEIRGMSRIKIMHKPHWIVSRNKEKLIFLTL